MTPEAIRDKLAEVLGIEIQWQEGGLGDPFATVPHEKWLQACELARNDESLFFDFLRAQTGTDYPDDEAIEVVCHLFSYKHRHAFVLKTRVSRSDPKLDSLIPVWPAANWYEREIYDLLGVHFNNHPDLRRLVLPDDWVGHPLRKDYEEQETYRGIPTQREGYAKFEAGGKKKKDRPAKEAKPAAEAAGEKSDAAPSSAPAEKPAGAAADGPEDASEGKKGPEEA